MIGTLALAAFPLVSQAQFNFEGLLNSAVDAVVKEGVNAVSSLASNSVSTSAMDSKPAGWPSNYKWHDYSQTAPQPAYKGRIRAVRVPGWENGLDFNTLPLQHAIVRVHGDGSRKMAVFADPTCPYTRQLEKDLNKLDNVTIYTFVAPLLGEHSRDLSNQVLCQANNQARAQAWDNLILNEKKPVMVAGCSSPADEIIAALGRLKSKSGKTYSRNSPSVVFSSNIASPGAVPASFLTRLIDGGTK